MYRAEWPLLAQSGLFVRYILKKQAQAQAPPPSASWTQLGALWGGFGIDFASLFEDVSNESTTFAQK